VFLTLLLVIRVFVMQELIITYNNKDTKLVRAVERAVRKNIPPDQVEVFVGVEPNVNTLSNDPAYHLRPKVSIYHALPEWTSPIDVHSAAVVIYWIRPVDAQDPKVIGIIWDKEGRSHLLSGLEIP